MPHLFYPIPSSAKRCLFLGYRTGLKGYLFQDYQTKRVIKSGDAKFVEHECLHHAIPRHSPTPESHTEHLASTDDDSSDTSSVADTVIDPSAETSSIDEDEYFDAADIDANEALDSNPDPSTLGLRRSARISRLPEHLARDYVLATAHHPTMKFPCDISSLTQSVTDYILEPNSPAEAMASPQRTDILLFPIAYP